MLSFPKIELQVAPVSNFRLIVLVGLFSTACLYVINLGGTEVLSIEFNKTFLSFVSAFGTVPHRHFVHP